MEDSKESRLRAEFEAWMRAKYPEAKFVRYSDSGPRQWHRFDRPGEYEFHEVQFAWEGWQAATERAAAICDSVNNHDNPMTARDCADAIRGE